MLQFLLDQFARLIIQHGNTLLSCVQIHAYNFHLGLLRSEQSVVRAPPSYSARCEADFVMPSDGTFTENCFARSCMEVKVAENLPSVPRGRPTDFLTDQRGVPWARWVDSRGSEDKC